MNILGAVKGNRNYLLEAVIWLILSVLLLPISILNMDLFFSFHVSIRILIHGVSTFTMMSSLFAVCNYFITKLKRHDLLGYPREGEVVIRVSTRYCFITQFILITLFFSILMFLSVYALGYTPSFLSELRGGAVYGVPLSLALCLYMKVNLMTVSENKITLHFSLPFFRDSLFYLDEIKSYEIKRGIFLDVLRIETPKKEYSAILAATTDEIIKMEAVLSKKRQ